MNRRAFFTTLAATVTGAAGAAHGRPRLKRASRWPEGSTHVTFVRTTKDIEDHNFRCQHHPEWREPPQEKVARKVYQPHEIIPGCIEPESNSQPYRYYFISSYHREKAIQHNIRALRTYS